MKLVFDPLLGGGGTKTQRMGVKFCVDICQAHINLVLGGQLAPPKKTVFWDSLVGNGHFPILDSPRRGGGGGCDPFRGFQTRRRTEAGRAVRCGQ